MVAPLQFRKGRDPHTQGMLLLQRQMPSVIEIPLTAAMVATTVVEVPWRGREFGAIQIVAADGGAIVATAVVEGSLKDDEAAWSDKVNRYVCVVAGQDSDYDGTAILTFTNEKSIKFIGPGKMYARIRVRLTALTGTNAVLRVL